MNKFIAGIVIGIFLGSISSCSWRKELVVCREVVPQCYRLAKATEKMRDSYVNLSEAYDLDRTALEVCWDQFDARYRETQRLRFPEYKSRLSGTKELDQ